MNRDARIERVCSCGKRGGAALEEGKAAFVRYFRVACAACGRQTAKHRRAEEAVREWNEWKDADHDSTDGAANESN